MKAVNKIAMGLMIMTGIMQIGYCIWSDVSLGRTVMVRAE